MALIIHPGGRLAPFAPIESPFSLGRSGPKYARDLGQAGFFSMEFGGGDWAECHQWCLDTYGDRYTWTGHTFWFLTEQDAMWFALRWA